MVPEVLVPGVVAQLHRGLFVGLLSSQPEHILQGAPHLLDLRRKGLYRKVSFSFTILSWCQLMMSSCLYSDWVPLRTISLTIQLSSTKSP